MKNRSATYHPLELVLRMLASFFGCVRIGKCSSVMIKTEIRANDILVEYVGNILITTSYTVAILTVVTAVVGVLAMVIIVRSSEEAHVDQVR